MSKHETSRAVANHFVYRLHGAASEVIYVGRSVNVARRIAKHNTFPRKPWIEDVRSVSMFGPLSREGAIAAERREIARLQPSGNVALTARDHRPFVAHMSQQAAGGTWATERWKNESGALVTFTVDESGRVAFDRDALAMLLVAAGFAQQAD